MNTPSIFIVEDEIITAKSIAKNIKNLGYQISGIATTGTKAILKIAELEPDLILMDILLKKDDIDGITTAQKIKEQINIPIVYLTAHSDNETLERAKLTAPFGYILKPYSKKDLQITIKMALYKHSQDVKIAERENLLSKILNSTKEGVIAANKTNTITYINPAAEEIIGYTFEETLGQNIKEIINFLDTKDKTSIPHPIQQVIEKGQVVYLDNNIALIARNGQKIPIQDSVAPILKQSTNEIEGAVLIFSPTNKSFFSDIDSFEEDSPQTLENLPTKEKFEESSKNLFSLISHELRNPLAIILSTSESLRRYRHRWTEEKQNSCFDKIQKAVGQMIQSLEDISIWQQAGSGNLFFQPKQTDIINFCEDVLSNIPLLNHDRQLIFSHQLQERIAFIDGTLLRYTLNNILLNAIKYSPQYGVISLTVTTSEDGILFKIQDRGVGIPFQEQSRLFDSFYRGSNVGHIPGTGLGLAIAKNCIELHKGNIYVESELDRGTTFSILVPTKLKEVK